MIPKLSLTNNEGYTFTFQRHKSGCSIQIEDKFGLSLGKADHICIDGIPKLKLRVIKNAAWERREGIIVRTVKKIFSDLVKEAENTSRKRTYKVQFYKQRGRSIVVIGPYGLAGGGLFQVLGFATGAAKVSFGLFVTSITPAFPLLLPAGTGLIASGSGDMYYSYQTPEDKMSADDFMSQSTINFGGGALAGGVGALATPLVAPLGPVVAPIAASAMSNMANDIGSAATEALIVNDSKVLKRLTPGRMAKKALVGVISNGAAKMANRVIDEAGKKIFKKVFDHTDEVVVNALKTSLSGIGGAAGGVAAKVTENIIRDNSFVTVMYKTRIPVDEMEPGVVYLHIRRGAVYYRYKNLYNQVVQVHLTDKVLVGITPKDGNSLFNAFAHQLIWSGIQSDATARGVRRELIAYLRENWSRYQKYQVTTESKKEYLKRLASNGQQGRRLELHALADCYKVQIQVTKKSSTSFYGDERHIEFTLLLNDKFYYSLFTHAAKEDLDGIKSILKLKARKPLNCALNNLIRTIAGKYGHFPTELLEGYEGAFVVGGVTGAVVDATNRTIERRRAAEVAKILAEKEEEEKKRKAEEDANENDPKKIHLIDEEQLLEEEDDVVVPVQLSPEEQGRLQSNFDLASERHENTLTLSQCTPIDMENKGNVIFDSGKEKYLSIPERIKFMELELNRLYGIPVGTGTESFEYALNGHHPRKAIALCIQRILLDWQSKGSGIAQAKALLDQAAKDLKNGRVSTTPYRPTETFNIVEMVIDSENYSETVGHHKNAHVQMKYLASRIAGSDTGEFYNALYFAFVEAYRDWLRQPKGKNKPTQHGFLTSVTDQFINGKNTVAPEMPHYSFLQKGVNVYNWINSFTDTPITLGIGAQTNGSNLQVGPKDYPTLFTVISSDEPKGVDGFQLPGKTPSGPAPYLTEYSPPTVSGKIEKPSQTTTPKPAISPGNGPGTQLNDYKPLISTAGHAVLATWQHGVKNTHTVPHGAQRFLSGMVDKVVAPLVAIDYYMDPSHQNEPKKHKMLCTGAALVADYGISLIAGSSCSVGTPAAGFAAAAAVSPLAAMAGKEAQDLCHKVLKGENDGLHLSGKKKISFK